MFTGPSVSRMLGAVQPMGEKNCEVAYVHLVV